MGFYSKHNKYVSTPDWFGSTSALLVLSTVQQTISTIASSGSVVTESTSVRTNVNLYNKFVVEYVDVTSDILTISDTAIVAVAIESDTTENIVSVGTLLSVSGWKTSDFIAIAANTTLTITATLHSNYGIVFYDNTRTPINGITVSTIPQSITIPENAFYFRLCNESEQTFALRYAYSLPYTKSQLDASDSNISDYLSLNANIPEGINTTSFELNELSLLVQNPLKLTKDKNNVIKLSLDQKSIETESNVYVTVDEAELDIQGVKTFVNGIKIGDSSLSQIQEDVVYLNSNLIVKGGITMYADGGDIDIPGIYDGIPIDGETLFWGTDSEGNEVLMSKSGTIKNVYVSGNGNALSSVSLTEDNTALSFLKSYTFATEGDLSKTKGELLTLIDTKADQTYVDETFVTFKKDEDIEGIKNFLNGIKINGHAVKQYDNYDDAIYIDANLIVRGGVTMYADGGNIDIPNIFAALPIANTLKWIETTDDSGNITEVLGVNPDIEFGLNEDELTAYLNEHKYATQSWVYSLKYATTTALNELSKKVNDFLEGSDTDVIINKWKELESFLSGLSESDNLATILGTKADKAIKINAGTGLSGGGTLEADRTLSLDTSGVTAGTYKSVTVDKYGRVTSGTNPTTLAGYGITDAYTKSAVDTLLGNYVTLGTAQTITGEKDFTGGLKVNGSPIVYDATNKYWKLEGDLLVTGGVTMFASDSAFTPSTIMNAIATDGTNLKVINGVLTFVGSIDGGEAGSVAWENVEGKPSFASVATSGKYSDLSGAPTLLSSFTNDLGFIDSSALSAYLPLSGGQMTGNIGYTLSLDSYAIGLPAAGSFESLAGIDKVNSYKSFIGSIYTGDWYHVLSIRHRNGKDNGNMFGLLLYTTFATDGSLEWNRQYNGSWTNRRVILDSVNWSQYISAGQIGAYLPLSGGTLTGRLNVYNTLNAGQNINGTATIDAFNGMAYYGCDAVSNGQITSSTGAFIAIKGTTGFIAMGHNNPLYKLDVAASTNQIVRVKSVGNAEASIRYTNNSDKTWVAGIGCAGIGDGFGIYSYTYGQNALYCDNTGMTVFSGTTAIGNKGIAFNRNIHQGGIFDSSDVGVQMHIEDGGLLVSHFNTLDKGVSVALFARDGFLSYGGITMYSDIRKKTKLQDVELTLQQIAEAPLIEHYYNSDAMRTTHVGSIAQYWAGLNDWFCKLDNEGFYTMEIQNAALASAISIARELSRYETKTDRKIRLLKQRVKELEDKIEKLENN